jgi:competence protein ComEC
MTTLRRYALMSTVLAWAGLLIVLHAFGLYPRPGLYDVSRLSGAPLLTLSGVVVDFPMVRWGQTRFLMDARAEPLTAFRGRLLVTLPFISEVGPGDRLLLTGWLGEMAPGRDGFDQRGYWASRGVYARFKIWSERGLVGWEPASGLSIVRPAWRFHRAFCRYWRERLEADAAGLLLGVTMGARGQLSAALKESCVRAGIYHLVVVSGQNVGLIIALGVGLLRLFRLPLRWIPAVAAGPILFYCAAVGADPPVLRATAMALAGLSALAMRRDIPRLYPLTLAALVVLISEPTALFGASFQLSFGATASLFAVIPFLEDGENRGKLREWLRRSVIFSLAVHVGIWPLLLLYFQRISTVGLPMNWILFPASAVLMVLGLVFGTLGVATGWNVPAPAFLLIQGLLAGALGTIRTVGDWRWSTLLLPSPGLPALALYYGFLFSILFVIYRRKLHGQNLLPLPARRNRLQPRKRSGASRIPPA